jgi:hypothetical protein
MKKQLIIFLILFALIANSLVILYKIPPAAKATYVEGSITQDTDWTLVDSPFVLSNNVTVIQDVTLTVEPGVEVRFGEQFTLEVLGRIVADGTDDKMIWFTSNKLEPTEGDWETILFAGPQQSSLTHCIVEYATSGITLNSGTLNLQDSIVRLNSENGTTVNDGSIIITNNEITNNTMNGIAISGGAQIDMQNNVISSNGNGIALTGHLTGTINVEQNLITLNTQGGIMLESDTYEHIMINRNNVSNNNNGFLVTSNTSTYITHNYISNNTVGISYMDGSDHQAHFNDIYDNEMGMDVSGNITVDATYNYWGDRTGPQHDSLNPQGKGNPVGGIGVDLDFIFFLSFPFDYNNTAPTATLWSDKTLVAPGQSVTFIGTDSQDDGRVDQYYFDFGDGTNTGWITLSLFNHTYSSSGTYIAALRVTDDFNVMSENIATTTITVQDLTPLNVQITSSIETANSDTEVPVSVYVSDELGPVPNANVMLFSLRSGSFSSPSGLTDSNGYFTSTFTVQNVTEMTMIRLIAGASTGGRADGSDHKYLKVIPILKVNITIDPATLVSEETAIVTVHVADTVDEPVADVSVTVLSSNGTFSETTGNTDSNGTATFSFTAPLTRTSVNVNLTVTATKTNYADGQAEIDIAVEPKRLVLEITADPDTVDSETTSTITAHVTYDSAPIEGATILASSDVEGNFTVAPITDADGKTALIFTAPRITIRDGVNASISVTASKDGYADAEAQTTITIMPRVLNVQITYQPNATLSEAQVNITVQIAYGTTLIPDANVTLTSETGSFSAPTGLTGLYGNVTFTFTAPKVNEETNVSIMALATKDGYLESTNSINVTVNPKTLNLQITVPPPRSEEQAKVTVFVTCKEDATIAEGVEVTLWPPQGGPVTNITDSSGICEFTVSTPPTPAQFLNMTFSAIKDGYRESQTKVAVPIVQPGPGFPFTTVLLIAIPAVVVVIAILIKLKIIEISTQEES